MKVVKRGDGYAFMQDVNEGFHSRIGGLANAFLYAAMPLGAILCSG